MRETCASDGRTFVEVRQYRRTPLALLAVNGVGFVAVVLTKLGWMRGNMCGKSAVCTLPKHAFKPRIVTIGIAYDFHNATASLQTREANRGSRNSTELTVQPFHVRMCKSAQNFTLIYARRI